MLSRVVNWFKTVPGLWVLILVCALHIVSGAADWSYFWGWLKAMPFVLIFLFLLTKVPRWQAVTVFVLVLGIVIPLSLDKSHNRLIYPAVGESLEIVPNTLYTDNNYCHSYTPCPWIRLSSTEDIRPQLAVPSALIVENMILHVESVKRMSESFGTRPILILVDSQGNKYTMANDAFQVSKAKGWIKTDIGESYNGWHTETFQSAWSKKLSSIISPWTFFVFLFAAYIANSLRKVSKREKL